MRISSHTCLLFLFGFAATALLTAQLDTPNLVRMCIVMVVALVGSVLGFREA